MTITIRKLHLAIAVLAVALIVPATAFAAHVFTDVPDGAFYAEPVEWAFNNEITTGKSPTSFAPNDNVTRGESVTFLQRYNDNVVQPAIDAVPDGPAGPPGPQGNQGNQGDQGVPGADGSISASVRRVTSTLDVTAGDLGFVTVECAVGETVIGGGFSAQPDAGISIFYSYPTVGGAQDDWRVGGRNDGLSDRGLTAYAECAS